MATQHNVKLVGMKSRTEIARIGSEIVGFIDADKKFAVVVDTPFGGDLDSDTITVKTAKGSYTLKKSLLANRYTGICNGVKCHFSKKKIVGKLIYWS